jgi:iron-sulfur cluster repair protein YtfE (RIC family)
MGGSAKATIDHDEIRAWVEARGGCPARVKRTGREGDPGILRIDFPGFSGVRTLEKISWDEFFDWFEKNELAFLHQDTTTQGKQSRFSKLVSRDSVDVAEASAPPSEKTAEAAKEPEAAVGDPIEVLEDQHEDVRRMFAELENGDLGVTPDLLSALALHLSLEEAIVYPMFFEGSIDGEIRESIVEHIGVKRMIRDLIDAPVADDAWWAGVRVLRRQVEEHMDREEDVILPVMRRELDDEQRAALQQEMEAFIVETLDTGSDAALESALSNTDARLEQP